jgi:SAM-dependent methyltransferase
MTQYDQEFFANQAEGSLRSARPIVSKYIEIFGLPERVIDVGCGVGAWLEAFGEHGSERLVGVDGIDQSVFPKSRFDIQLIQADLSSPLEIEESFDLAICLEVAEHLFENRAESLVRDLTALAPKVLFSAAIPGQGGTHHVNEQWASYWCSLFLKHGYVAQDSLRPIFWWDQRVEWWYRQNILVFEETQNPPKGHLGDESPSSLAIFPIDAIHPELRAQILNSTPTVLDEISITGPTNPPGASRRIRSFLELALRIVRKIRNNL